MTNYVEKYKNPAKRKQIEEEEDGEQSSIFEILENEFRIGDLVWTKLNGLSWWPAFVFGCFSDSWKHVKLVSKSGSSTAKKCYFVYCFGSHFKCGWIHQTCLYRYGENPTEQSFTKRAGEKLRNRFQSQISDELRPLWSEAVKEADELSALPVQSRVTALEKVLRRLLMGGKFKPSPSGQLTVADDVSISTLTNEDRSADKTPMSSSSCPINKRTVSNKRLPMSSELIEKSRRTFSIHSTRDEENDDIVFVKINAPISSSSVSLTTAICHFLDQGIPSLTIYEEIRLVHQLIHHRLGSLLTLTDAQLHFEQYVMKIASMNYNHRMLFVQCDYFYDFLLKYPQIILRHRQWFKDFKQTLMPVNSEKILLKKWQLATLLHAHCNLEQRFH